MEGHACAGVIFLKGAQGLGQNLHGQGGGVADMEFAA